MATSSPDSPRTYILGVGLTPFLKPRGQVPYTHLALTALTHALLDASVPYDAITAGIACSVFTPSTSGQRCFYQLGMTGIPIHNISNNCATGSSGLVLARQLCQLADLQQKEAAVLVLGYDVMAPGALPSGPVKPDAIGRFTEKMVEQRGYEDHAPGASQLFGKAGKEYMERHPATTTADDFVEVARINHAHSVNNPYAQFRRAYTADEIKDSGDVFGDGFLTKLQCCPTSDGAAAAVVVSESFLSAHPHLRERAVEMAGISLATDTAPTFASNSMMELVGYSMTRSAAAAALQEARVSINDIRVVELHDCFSANEMITLEALGLCEKGQAGEMVRRGDITYGGKYVVNPSGGLISKGHPLGATGLAQAAELVWQLRGWANNRLVSPGKEGEGGGGGGGVQWALQHNLGLGGAAVVAVYRRADGERGWLVGDEEVGRKSGVGYNPAVEARPVTREQVERVRSKEMGSEWALGDAFKKAEAKL